VSVTFAQSWPFLLRVHLRTETCPTPISPATTSKGKAIELYSITVRVRRSSEYVILRTVSRETVDVSMRIGCKRGRRNKEGAEGKERKRRRGAEESGEKSGQQLDLEKLLHNTNKPPAKINKDLS